MYYQLLLAILIVLFGSLLKFICIGLNLYVEKAKVNKIFKIEIQIYSKAKKAQKNKVKKSIK